MGVLSVGVLRSLTFYKQATAARMWARMRDADVGAGRGPGSAAEEFAARAWTNAAAAAASAAGSPAASSAPIMPDSTSPDPAVAAHDWPAGFRYTRPPGAAITVTLPLSRTVAPNLSASRRVAPMRSSPGGEPASRANSPACGVSTVGADRDATASGWAARMVSASASTITGRSVPSANHSALAPAASVPTPGPTTQACTFPADSAVAEAMTSGQCESTCSAALPAYLTMPDVAATAAPVHSTAAPG